MKMKLKYKSIVVAMAFSAVSHTSFAEVTTPKAILNNNGSDRIIAISNFAVPVTGDLYIATAIEGQLLFLINNGEKFTSDVAPFVFNQEYIGKIQLFDFAAAGILAGRYPLYQVVTETGTDPLDFTNWVGGLAGLSMINFNIGLPTNVTGDFDHNGFADDDLNKDGFHDDDLNKDGFHDDDLNKDGFHDDDLNQDGFHDEPDPIISTIEKGKVLYSNCSNSACHGLDPKHNINDILGAVNADKTRSAINKNKGGMGFLNFLSDADLQAIADFVRNPQ